MSAVITQKHLELRVGQRTVSNFCDDNGDGVADEPIVREILEEAQDIAEGILKKGWPDQSARVQLIEDDRAVRGAVVDIALGLMGRRRPELLSSDQKTGSLYDGWRKQGEAVLERVATAERRARGEDVPQGAGPNAHVAQGANQSPAPLVFVTSRKNNYSPRGTY